MSALGHVALVGAGPGDPELLTVRAARRLADADVVFYDALVHPDLLELAAAARHVFVGKRGGQPSTPQAAINAALIGAAYGGAKVVRLKAGDPFVLGRGGEEAQALTNAGVPFEIVPGLTTAIAGPALAGIPVTHRGAASGFTVVSGHAARTFGPVIDGLPVTNHTLVLLMALAQRGVIAARLAARGWAPHTPAAIVQAAGTPESATWIGRLDALASAALPGNADAPGLLVIGDAIGVATDTAEFRRPWPLSHAAESNPTAAPHAGIDRGVSPENPT